MGTWLPTPQFFDIITLMSKKKFITLTITAALIVGTILAGGLFNLIDIIIVRPIVNLLFMIYNLVGDFGLAIIIFTVLVKLLTIPLTKKQLHQTRLMRKIQPELAKIRKNCNGNKQLESLQTMDLYKRYNVKPFRSVLTLFIQLPIFIAIFGAIRVIATPLPTDNLSNRAYDIVAYDGSIIKELKEKQEPYLLDLTNPDIPSEQKTAYDYHPQLFGKVNLEAKASDLLKGFSWSALFMMICSVAAAVVQYLVARQQMPSGKAEKQKKFRDLLKEASAGKDVDQSDISAMSTRQMSMMMPFMMFLIMFNLHGALAFYYFLSNLLTVLIQKVILKKARDDMDDMTDSTITKELKKIQEAEVVNKKTGTKITRISVKDNKKKRR